MFGKPVLYFASGAVRIYFAHLSYDAKNYVYPVDVYLKEMHPTDCVFLLLTWSMIGLDTQRYEQYQSEMFPCQVCRRRALELPSCHMCVIVHKFACTYMSPAL